MFRRFAIPSLLSVLHIGASTLTVMWISFTMAIVTSSSKSSTVSWARCISVNHSVSQDFIQRVKSPCSQSTGQTGIEANCSRRNIQVLTADWFPCDLQKLSLEGNSLLVLRNTSFAHLLQLRWLSVRNNRIERIEQSTFENLVHLEYLNLEYNQLKLSSESYPPGLFSPLTQLKTLRLAHQRSEHLSSSYPEDFIFNVSGLHALSIPTLGEILHFGPEFCQLKDLSRLEISGSVRVIRNSSFDGLTCLTLVELSIHELPYLSAFELDSLNPLRNSLRLFHMDNVPVGL
ncbi:toll-like receptor 2 [Aplysia californica]|uniref:Toll-like receptor 2 n=1 Tax=Aplysia californica TaxID=6500 RepID=A0ABM1A0E3_APLCA|nr:toll-like receptor 2 [Aplysia californica]